MDDHVLLSLLISDLGIEYKKYTVRIYFKPLKYFNLIY